MTPEQVHYYERAKKNAPSRCEMCDAPLATFAEREKHLVETSHCACFECGRYMPPGFVYSHWSVLHDDLHWNDHQIAGGDTSTLREALPWVREAFQKKVSFDVDEWLGLKRKKAKIPVVGESTVRSPDDGDNKISPERSVVMEEMKEEAVSKKATVEDATDEEDVKAQL